MLGCVTPHLVWHVTNFHLVCGRLSIDNLLKFIDSYDGNRDNLSCWLTNCDRAFSLAQECQKPILFAFVQNKLIDKAQSTCANTIFES